jgi:RimJ/RimL family protein N-acetyltransferase
MSNASKDMRDKGNRENFPGFDYPLEFSPIRPHHRHAMIKAIWCSHKQLRGWIGWAKYSRSWDTRTVNRFINDHINDPLPNQHFVYLIGGEVVGMGSLVGCYTPYDAQVALWIVPRFQGKGLGKAIVDTLEYVAFNVWGFETLYYEHDSQNEISKKLPRKCGFKLSHTRDIEKSAEKESGFWFSWKKDRPKGLPDAIIQGRPVEDFTTP